jgi:periplasmic protein TonB
MSAVAGSAGVRLGWALFVALAAHGAVILGVGFSSPDAGGPGEVPTLEVTLLQSPLPDPNAPADAQYLAQANQHGAGNVAETVEAAFFDAPPAPDDLDASDRGQEHDFTPPRPEEPAAEALTSWRSPLQARLAPTFTEAEARPAEARPDGGVTQVTATGEREYFVAVSAREALFAEYLAAWKARMERLGTLNYPAAAAGLRGQNPVLEVAVGADGNIRAIRVVQSSGRPALDQATIDLVRLGSPYDPFPRSVRAQYDVLRFVYEWRFIEGQAAPGALRATPD